MTTHLSHRTRIVSVAVAALALPLAAYLTIATLANTGGTLSTAVLGLGLGAMLLACTLPLVLCCDGSSRVPARMALGVATLFLFVTELYLAFGVGAGTCSNDAPPATGSPVDRFCNGPAIHIWNWGLLSVFPILLLGFAMRHGRARNWPFALALVAAAGMLVALVAALP